MNTLITILMMIMIIDKVISAPCGYERTKIASKTAGGDCSDITTEKDCVLSIYAWPYGTPRPFVLCYWNSGSCNSYNTLYCEPSCFADNRQNYVSCPTSSAGACNDAYTGTYGSSNICNYNYDSMACESRSCDLTCTGSYQKTSTCTGLSQYQCETYYYDDGTDYKNCKWTGSSCTQGEKCRKICNGVSSVANCTTYNNNALSCKYAYETRGSATYDCLYNVATAVCSSKYPQQCTFPGASSCAGTYGGLGSCSSFFTTRSSCDSGFVYDDTIRQCKWNIGSGICNNDKPCTVP